MADIIFPLLISKPVITVSLVLSVVGIIRKGPIWLIIGAILAVPLSLYSSRFPPFMGIGIFLPLFQFGAAVAIHKHVTWLAWLLLIPFTTIIGGVVGGFGLIVLFIALIYLIRSLNHYLINDILKNDKNRISVLFALIVLLIFLNIILIIIDKFNLDYTLTLFVLFTGLPGITASLVFSVVGIIKRDSAWLITGAVLAIPFASSISGSPLFSDFWIFLPLFQLGAATAVYKNVMWLAWLLLIPSVSITGWLELIRLLR